MEHPEFVDDLSAKKLAEKFMKTTYGYQLEFFEEMKDLYKKDSKNDKQRGYIKLSELVVNLSSSMLPVCETMKKVWRICKPRTNI